jgi:HK97 family phage major capsid protein
MSDLEDRFEDKLIDMVARDRPRDQYGNLLPSVPAYPSLQIDPIPDTALGDAIQPFDEEMSRAQQYVGDAWDGTKTSYFRDKCVIAEKNHRMQALMHAQLEGRDYMPPAPIPSRAEALSGGVEGAIARSSEASMHVERRVREVRSRMKREQPKSYQELRAAISTSSGGVGLVPASGAPRYVAELFADQARVKARLASRLLQGQLPSSGKVVLVPRATTGAVMGIQTSEGNAYTDSSMVTDTATSPVVTIVGKQDVSRELLDRGVNTDADIAASLGASFAGQLEAQVINGSGASGQLTGLLGTTGIVSNSYTDASATSAEAFGAIQKLLSDTGTAYGAPIDTLVMHSRRARWLSDNAVFGSQDEGAEVLETQGIPVNLGAGTNEDAIIAMALAETPLFIGPINFEVDPGVLSGTLQVRIFAWAYCALVGARIPASIGKLGGTDLITPVFP